MADLGMLLLCAVTAVTIVYVVWQAAGWLSASIDEGRVERRRRYETSGAGQLCRIHKVSGKEAPMNVKREVFISAAFLVGLSATNYLLTWWVLSLAR